ncbi:hypothetical protein [Amycolatopsis nigrescens]|uniref:hypothetical protein n=1 Tax=Amycolatopsis nigrescens TaxID=381445 RepID=UPI00036B30FC|nr:hypothetical protein [Amycolatopsis nigrescens]
MKREDRELLANLNRLGRDIGLAVQHLVTNIPPGGPLNPALLRRLSHLHLGVGGLLAHRAAEIENRTEPLAITGPDPAPAGEPR